MSARVENAESSGRGVTVPESASRITGISAGGAEGGLPRAAVSADDTLRAANAVLSPRPLSDERLEEVPASVEETAAAAERSTKDRGWNGEPVTRGGIWGSGGVPARELAVAVVDETMRDDEPTGTARED
jgi:hypothetical protein